MNNINYRFLLHVCKTTAKLLVVIRPIRIRCPRKLFLFCLKTNQLYSLAELSQFVLKKNCLNRLLPVQKRCSSCFRVKFPQKSRKVFAIDTLCSAEIFIRKQKYFCKMMALEKSPRTFTLMAFDTVFSQMYLKETDKVLLQTIPQESALCESSNHCFN